MARKPRRGLRQYLSKRVLVSLAMAAGTLLVIFIGYVALLDRQISAVISRSRRKTLAEVDGRSLPVRLRDGVARLFSPYL